MDRSPSFLRGIRDRFPASSTDLALRLCGVSRGWRWRLRFALQLRPSRFLSKGHPSSCGGGNLTLPGGRFRRGGRSSGATVQDGPEFCDLYVDVPLLFLKSEDGGGEYLWVEFCWHVRCCSLSGFSLSCLYC